MRQSPDTWGGYLWEIEDRSPKSDAELWKMMGDQTAEYYHAIEIRDSATSTGEALKWSFRAENRERANYSALDYMQRFDAIEDQNGENAGVLIEWGEVRVSDNCSQTLMQIQTLANSMKS